MSTHNIGFYEDLTKIFFQLLSSNMNLIQEKKSCQLPFVSCQFLSVCLAV